MIPRLVRGLLLITFALAFVIPPAIARRGGRGGGGGGRGGGEAAAAVEADAAWRRRRRDAAWRRVAAVGASLTAQRSAAPDRLSGPRWPAERAASFDPSQQAFGWCRSTGSRPRRRPSFDPALRSWSWQSPPNRRAARHR